MKNINSNKFFFLISSNQIKFAALDENNKTFFEKKIFSNNEFLEGNFGLLKKFLDQSVISFEKKFKSPIEDVSLIIDLNKFVTINVSTAQNLNYVSNENENSSINFINIKDDVLKHMNGYDLIHMIIKKYIVNGKEYFSIPKQNLDINIFIELQFIFLKNDIYKDLRKIFSKYEITINKILDYKYVDYYHAKKSGDLFDITDKLINGYNENEILFTKKVSKNLGFFEKFFNLFN